jgi:hypothetical protein
MSESIKPQEQLPKLTDSEAVAILRNETGGPLAIRWFDQIKSELDLLHVKCETQDDPDDSVRADIWMSIRVAIVKFRAGYSDDAIEDLQNWQIGGNVNDKEDRIVRALGYMKSGESAAEAQLEILLGEVNENLGWMLE